ncbi:hypothetical protein M440DRAFT_1400733 [Trichoderma longibrachiatum ATCC 18648]|uniref:Electron transfer flavoprotein-ubiquinone oxidoreductase n=1 Tax=Trichoderma longibrachiatum ATCC 18648 TaxID=983965 RepID=A0A2T4C897_TRILO|nr:hypothetical protein M440DRAFT_1400733 [Trichoderma longibrachiatum ATCC 18648]
MPLPAPTPVSRCALRTTRAIPRCRPARFLGPVAATRRAPFMMRPSIGMPQAAAARPFSTAMRLRMAAEDESFDPATIERESDQVDVCIIGAGPAGLSAAIRLKQLANEAGNEDFRVLVLEKAGEVGAHILSGAVIQPSAINELIPDWLDESNPSRFEHATPAGTDKMRFLTKTAAIPIPAPPQMNNHGNYIVSLNQFVKWLGERAEEVGVELYPGFAAAEVLYNADGSVKGVATNDLGIGRDGRPKDSFERGMEFHARVTMFGEGCHGSLTKKVVGKFDLRRDSRRNCGVSRTGTNHEEDQPVHLQVKDWDAHTDKAYPPFKGLENRFCPAGVYEYVEDESKPHGVRFQINAQNCIHCKTCDIKAPQQDINWQVPQGGEGPKYYMT